MSALAAVQIKRRQLALADDDWRDVVERVTGKRSTRDLRSRELGALLAECDRLLCGRAPTGAPRRPLGGKYAGQLQALWISCWNLGLVEVRDDKALIAFVKRQTGIDNPAWMHGHDDARKVIEALKAMLARHGVRWSFPKEVPCYERQPGYQVALAQYRLVGPQSVSFNFWVADQSGFDVIHMKSEDWIGVMNVLGRKVRVMKRTGGAA